MLQIQSGKTGKRAIIESEARKLARSGQYHTFRSIEAALLARGFDEVRAVFRNRWTCFELDRICQQALGMARAIHEGHGG